MVKKMVKAITKEALAAIGGFNRERIFPEPLNVARTRPPAKDNPNGSGTWPPGMPEPTVFTTIEDDGPIPEGSVIFIGEVVYEKSAAECAEELGTTKRQISRLRQGSITQAKPLSWYKENKKPTG